MRLTCWLFDIDDSAKMLAQAQEMVKEQGWQNVRLLQRDVRQLDILSCLGGFYEETGDFARAAEYARRLIVLESWRESYHRLLMRNLAQAGQRKAALAQYEQCRQELAKELSIEPSAKTRKLYEGIRDLDKVTESAS